MFYHTEVVARVRPLGLTRDNLITYYEKEF